MDPNIGSVVGRNGIILRTSNGGVSWTRQSSATFDDLSGVSFVDPNTGTAVGGNLSPLFGYGTILHTNDGGQTWAPSEGALSFPFQRLLRRRQRRHRSGDGRNILRTSNGGATWAAQSSGTSNSLNAVFFADFDTGTAVGTTGTSLVQVAVRLVVILGRGFSALLWDGGGAKD